MEVTGETWQQERRREQGNWCPRRRKSNHFHWREHLTLLSMQGPLLHFRGRVVRRVSEKKADNVLLLM